MIRRILVAVALLLSMLVVAGPAPADESDGTLTGLVRNRRGVPLADVRVSIGQRTTVTGDDGRFLLTFVAAGQVELERVGYAPQSLAWSGDTDWVTVTMAPRIVRGIHVAGWVAGDDDGWQDMLDIAASTGVNTMMIDLKNEGGNVYFDDLGVATVGELGALEAPITSLAGRVAEAHGAGLYTIVRIVTFQDPKAAALRPWWAVTDTTTGQPMVSNGQYFLDPHDLGAQQYALDLAVAACDAGIDEVQFDYVRFPDGDKSSLAFDGPADEASRQETITAFLALAREKLVGRGCATAADIFGFITNKTHEGGIGQQLEAIAGAVDVISPMVYPSHYSTGWYGFTVPNDHPGPVVTNASQDALDRMTETQAILRPWLQDFSYTAAQVREQIEAIDGLGIGWMLWNILSQFTVSGIPIESALEADESVPAPEFLVRPNSGFFDVADGHLFAADIAWLAANGITTGCDAPWGDLFCPTESVTRGQMAAFLARALDLTVPAGPDSFTDDDGSVFETDIEALVAAGITTGCGPERFCPAAPVTRGQMASFLARALGLAGGGSGAFVDDDGSPHEASIEAVAAAGITRGCHAGSRYFCPSEPVTRGQMAAFLARALGDG